MYVYTNILHTVDTLSYRIKNFLKRLLQLYTKNNKNSEKAY